MNLVVITRRIIPTCILLCFFIGADAQRNLLIHSVRIIDGTGSKSYIGSVRLRDSIIVEVGQLTVGRDDSVFDGRGMVLSPGFIDTHSHHYGDLEDHPEAMPTNSQGITTIVIGQDGNGDPIDSILHFVRQKPVAVNLATYTGHTSLRERVMGSNDLLRPASKTEIDAMRRILTEEMRKGSIGLSTGLEYEEAFYSTPAEVLQLAQTAADEGGRYISHIRSEDITLDSAIEEIINIGRLTRMPVQISHLKIGLKDRWGSSVQILERLEKARKEGIRVTADVYPYDFWNSTLRVLFPKRDYQNLSSAEFAVQQLFDPSQSVLVRYAPAPSYVGKTFSDISGIRKQREAQTLMDLVAESQRFRKEHPNVDIGVEAIAAKAMSEEDVHRFIGWTFSNICSDGRAGGHPRGYGAFTKILRVYVRERKDLSWEEAVHKMTGLGAEHVGLVKRGLIRPGFYADLVLFDPDTVSDRSDLSRPTALSTGIIAVWINGRQTYVSGQATGLRPGVFISR